MLGETVGEELEIVTILKAWGEWQRSRSGAPSGGGGLIGSYHEREDHGQGLVIMRDPQSEDIDLLVCKMGQAMGIQYKHVLVAKYVNLETMRGISEALRCSEALAKVRLQTAHAWMNGVVFGVRLRVIG